MGAQDTTPSSSGTSLERLANAMGEEAPFFDNQTVLERIYWIAQIEVENDANAEDVAQDAAIRVWRAATAKPEEYIEAPAGFLSTLVRNIAVDHHRKRKTRPEVPLEPKDGETGGLIHFLSSSQGEDPVDIAMDNEMIKELAYARRGIPGNDDLRFLQFFEGVDIDTLPEAMRTFKKKYDRLLEDPKQTLAHFLEGNSCDEIGRLTNTKLSTVLTRLHYARAKLAEGYEREQAIGAMAKMVRYHQYVTTADYLKSDPTSLLAFAILWKKGPFQGSILDANEVFQKEYLGLSEREMQEYALLAEITDNESCLLEGSIAVGRHPSAKKKVPLHLEIVQQLIENTTFTPRQDIILEAMLDDQYLAELAPGLGSQDALEYDAMLIRQKLRVTAIQNYQDLYEQDVKRKHLENQLAEMTSDDHNLSINNKHYRIYLQLMIEKWVEEKGCAFDQFAKESTYNNLGRLKRIARDVFGSIYTMTDFAFPGEFKHWQFETKEPIWRGASGRQTILEAMNHIMQKEGTYLFRRQDYLKWGLWAVERELVQEGSSMSTANQIYIDEFVTPNLQDPENIENYTANRKLLALLYGAKNPLPNETARLSHLEIETMDREYLFRTAELSEEEKRDWRARLDRWDFDEAKFYHPEVAQLTESTLHYVRSGFARTRPQLAQTLEQAYTDEIKRIFLFPTLETTRT